MNPHNKSPPTRNKRLSTEPKLVEELRFEYQRLLDTGKLTQTQILDKLREEYGGYSRTGIRLYLIPADKENQKKHHSRQWANQKLDPSKRKKIFSYKTYYTKIRRHIDQYVSTVFYATNKNPFTLEDLSDLVKKETNVGFKPQSFLHLSDQYQTKHGFPLLLPIHGYFETPKYVLNFEYNLKS